MVTNDGQRRGLMLALAYLVLLSLETGLNVNLGARRLRLDLLLILTVFTGLNLGPLAGALVGAGSGLLQELTGGRLLLALVGAKTAVGYGAGMLRGQLNERHFMVPTVLVGAMTLAHDGILMVGYFSQGWLTGAADSGTLLLYRTLPAAGSHMLVAALAYGLFRQVLWARELRAGRQEGSP